ncbi:MAG: DUF3887 domain-containing protein [Planctomycetes bacterium]|nr:DUF3887 domain-containing protein [Planctomycetota bacterium]
MLSFLLDIAPMFRWLVTTTLHASVIVCIVIAVKFLLSKRLAPRWHYYLWLLVIARMLMPVAPQSALSIFNLVGAVTEQTEITEPQPAVTPTPQTTLVDGGKTDYTPQPPIETAVIEYPTATVDEQVTAVSPIEQTPTAITTTPDPVHSDPIDYIALLPLGWLIGAVALAVYVLLGNIRLSRIVTHQRPVTDSKILDLLEDCKSQMNLHTYLSVVETGKVSSPALFGFIRPRLLLPEGLLEKLTPAQLRHVFLHELAHLKRGDIYFGWLTALLQTIHWFNPLVWFAFYKMRADRELACDQLALTSIQNEEPKEYGKTIVSLLENFSTPSYNPGLAGILEDRSQLKRRITMIAKHKKGSYRFSALAAIVIAMLCAVALTSAKDTTSLEEKKASANTFVDQLIEGQFKQAANSFDKTMKRSLPPEKLAKKWKETTQDAGPFEKKLGTRADKYLWSDIIYITCQFKEGPLDVKVVYNKNKQISGLWFVPVPEKVLKEYANQMSGISSFDHFIGRYATAQNPNLAALEITKKGSVYIFKDLYGPSHEAEESSEGLKFWDGGGKDAGGEGFLVAFDRTTKKYQLYMIDKNGQKQTKPDWQMIKLPAGKPKVSDPFNPSMKFGQVIEPDLSDMSKPWFDLDQNRTFTPPQWVVRENSTKALLKWYRNEGIDCAVELKYRGLGCIDTVAVKLDNKAWTQFSTKQLYDALRNKPPVKTTMEKDLPVVYLKGTGKLPVTYGFYTREGQMGILQIVGVEMLKFDPTGERNIKIRYKIAKTKSTTNASAWKELTLPDMDSPGNPAMLALDTHELVPLLLDRDEESDKQWLRKMMQTPDRSYLLYEQASNKETLMMVKGLSWLGVKTPESKQFKPIFKVISKTLPDAFKMTSHDGNIYEFTVLQTSRTSCKLRYRLYPKEEQKSRSENFLSKRRGKDTSAEAAYITQKVIDRYAGMKTFQAIGELCTEIKRPDDGKNDIFNKVLHSIKKKPLKSFYTIKMAKPNRYCIEWNAYHNLRSSIIGYAWSMGKGSHLLQFGEHRQLDKFSHALTAASRFTAQPALFFDISMNRLKELRERSLLQDERVEGVDCYVITGKHLTQTCTYWISKKHFLVRQYRQVSGGKVEELIEQAIKRKGNDITDEEIAKIKKQFTDSNKKASKNIHTNTQTYRNIIINEPISEGSFKPDENVQKIREKLKNDHMTIIADGSKFIFKKKTAKTKQPTDKDKIGLDADAEKACLDVKVSLKIRGKVTPPDCTVRLLNKDKKQVGRIDQSKDARYYFSDLVPGKYIVEAYFRNSDTTEYRDIELSENQEKQLTIDAVTDQVARIEVSGKVLNQETGKPIKDAYFDFAGSGRPIRTKEDGSFSKTHYRSGFHQCYVRKGKSNLHLVLDRNIDELIAKKLAIHLNPMVAKSRERLTDPDGDGVFCDGINCVICGGTVKADLPDLETKGAKTVLDLATGQMFSAALMERDRRYFDKQGKGDIAYDYAGGKGCLLCLRGAVMQTVSDSGPQETQPDIKRGYFNGYFIQQTPCQYQLTTAKGQKYDIKILSVEKGDKGGAKIEFRKSDNTAAVGEVTNKSILGVWEMVEIKGKRSSKVKYNQMTFRPDGTMVSEGTDNKGKYHNSKTKYLIKNNKLIMGDNGHSVDIELKNDRMTIMVDGSRFIYKRKRSGSVETAKNNLQDYLGTWEMTEAKGENKLDMVTCQLTFTPGGTMVSEVTHSDGKLKIDTMGYVFKNNKLVFDEDHLYIYLENGHLILIADDTKFSFKKKNSVNAETTEAAKPKHLTGEEKGKLFSMFMTIGSTCDQLGKALDNGNADKALKLCKPLDEVWPKMQVIAKSTEYEPSVVAGTEQFKKVHTAVKNKNIELALIHLKALRELGNSVSDLYMKLIQPKASAKSSAISVPMGNIKLLANQINTTADFQPGDSIEITEIIGTSEKIIPGHSYTIKGKYKLTSQDKAKLFLYATDGETTCNQGPTINKGQGEFTRTFKYQKGGWLHLSFYSYPGNEGNFGNLYFNHKGGYVPGIEKINVVNPSEKPKPAAPEH